MFLWEDSIHHERRNCLCTKKEKGFVYTSLPRAMHHGRVQLDTSSNQEREGTLGGVSFEPLGGTMCTAVAASSAATAVSTAGTGGRDPSASKPREPHAITQWPIALLECVSAVRTTLSFGGNSVGGSAGNCIELVFCTLPRMRTHLAYTKRRKGCINNDFRLFLENLAERNSDFTDNDPTIQSRIEIVIYVEFLLYKLSRE